MSFVKEVHSPSDPLALILKSHLYLHYVLNLLIERNYGDEETMALLGASILSRAMVILAPTWRTDFGL
jgi:hypothetical protein